MPIKIIKILLAGVFAGRLLKANRVRSVARFSRAGWVMFLRRLSFSGWCLNMRGREIRN